MLKLNTNRLSLWALSYDHIKILSNSRNKLEKILGLKTSQFTLNTENGFLQEFYGVLTEYVSHQLLKCPSHYEWYTHWLIVGNDLQLTIGGIGASGLPDECGQVMIGYFIDAKFEGKGFATEAVKSFTQWLFSHSIVLSIIADTPKENVGSQKVLMKAGFQLDGDVEEGFRWILTR